MSPTLVSKRSKEEIKSLEEQHGHILMAMDDFSLLNSPLGVLWVDKQHPEYKKIVEQCATYCQMMGDKTTAEKYRQLISAPAEISNIQ